jgi:hypothetical protein
MQCSDPQSISSKALEVCGEHLLVREGIASGQTYSLEGVGAHALDSKPMQTDSGHGTQSAGQINQLRHARMSPPTDACTSLLHAIGDGAHHRCKCQDSRSRLRPLPWIRVPRIFGSRATRSNQHRQQSRVRPNKHAMWHQACRCRQRTASACHAACASVREFPLKGLYFLSFKLEAGISFSIGYSWPPAQRALTTWWHVGMD